MNLDLKSEKINYLKPVFKRRFTREETAEVIVPDALPDILRIIETDGVPLMRSKDSDSGRASVAGVIEGAVLYVPESGNNICHIDINIPFSAVADDANILPDCLISAKVTLNSAESKTINPRKILVKAEIICEMSCFIPQEVYNSSYADSDTIYQKTCDVSLRLASSVNEKTFIFTDSLKIPSDIPQIGDVLKTSVSLYCEDIKPVGNKAVIKGHANTNMLVSSGEENQLRECSFQSPFSQVIDTDSYIEPESFDVQLMLTGAYISRDYLDDNGNDAFSLEIHAVAQCISYSEYNISYISDAYSIKHDLEINKEKIELTDISSIVHISSVSKGNIQLPCAWAKIEYVSAHPGPVVVSLSPEGTVLNSAIIVSVIYTDQEGNISSTQKKFEVQQEYSSENKASQLYACQELAGDIFSSVTESNVEIRIPIDIIVTNMNDVSYEYISSIDYDEKKNFDRSDIPSVVVVRVGSTFDIWELAKKYSSSEDLILKVNNLDSAAAINTGDVILIPKSR